MAKLPRSKAGEEKTGAEAREPGDGPLQADPRNAVLHVLLRMYGPYAVIDEVTTYMLGVAKELDRKGRDEDAQEWEEASHDLDDFILDELDLDELPARDV